MKHQFLIGILASSLTLFLLSTENISFASEVIENTQQYSQTLATSPEWDFEFSNGIITKYVGSGGDVVIPSTINGQVVTEIGEMAFYQNSNLISVILPDNVSTISRGAFAGCPSLKSVELCDSLKVIDEIAFGLCPQLSSITLPNSLTFIGEAAFYECTSLEEIVIPDSVHTLGMGVFTYCSSVKKVTLSQSLTSISNKLFTGCTSLSTVEIPNSVKHIEKSAFFMCENLQDIKFSNSLLTIDESAFMKCTSLEYIKLPDSLISLEDAVFSYCENLNHIEIGSSLSVIPFGTFSQCPNLTYVAVPSSVTQVGEYAFHAEINNQWVPAPNMIFYGEAGSFAQTYASEQGIPFQQQVTVESVSGYSDVYSTDWFAPYVSFATENNLMTGENGAFQPLLPSDRGTVAQALANMSGQAQNTEVPSSYVDVVGSPYEKAIAWCLETGVMSGFDTATFGTSSNLTREQFATTLRAYSEKMGVYVAPTSTDLSGYGDGWSISEWAKTSVAWAVENGLMKGSDGNLNPQGNVNRAEVAVMLMSYSEMSNHVPEIEVPVVPEVVPDNTSTSNALTEDEILNIQKVTLEHIEFIESHLKEATRHLNIPLMPSAGGYGILTMAEVNDCLTNLSYSLVYAEMAITEIQPLINISTNYSEATMYLQQYIDILQGTLSKFSSNTINATNYASAIVAISEEKESATLSLNQAIGLLK